MTPWHILKRRHVIIEIMNSVRIEPLEGIPLIRAGDNLGEIIYQTIQSNNLNLSNGDIVVIAHTIVSKAEGRIVNRKDISISDEAKRIAEKNDFDPHQVALALKESTEVLRKDRALITVTASGRICNFSGVDHSNAPPDSFVLLPSDSDASAMRIRAILENLSGKRIAVIITDTEGRPWRLGATNIAVGCSGINAFKYNKGKKDLHNRVLQSSTVCQVDELGAAAELVTGQAGEGIPVAVISGFSFDDGNETANDINRPMDETLFK
ncbi:coenzyme F420-0:L-glutamate ligase [Candidatus Thorarchaeota archaeon]|nr:MAG: coenzyme F420-0:L-glutamate ligase [Candidatus Thorarchaeota archaeon]